MDQELQKFIDGYMLTYGQAPSVAEINKFIQSYMIRANTNNGIPTLENYSIQQFGDIVFDLFGVNSPVQIKTLTDEDFQEIPLFRQLRFLIDLLLKEKSINLTKTGSFPTKLVKELYELGAKEEFIENGITKLYKESDSIYVQLVHILAKQMGVVKVQKGALTLTKNGEKLALNHQALVEKLLRTFSCKFNFSYFDGYENQILGGFGVGFSFVLFSKYGDEKRLADFYAEKYVAALPDVGEGFESTFSTAMEKMVSCYRIRVFERFMKPLGLVNSETVKGDKAYSIKHLVSKTPLFDKLIKVVGPYEK